MGKLKAALGALKKFGGADPLIVGGGLAATGLFAGQEIVAPLAEGVGKWRTQEKRDVNLANLLLQQRRRAQADAVRAEKLQRLVAENTARLATVHPDIYNAVLVGRKLPRGAVVIGSAPGGIDRVQQLAAAMSQGTFDQPKSAEDQYLAGL